MDKYSKDNVFEKTDAGLFKHLNLEDPIKENRNNIEALKKAKAIMKDSWTDWVKEITLIFLTALSESYFQPSALTAA